MRYVIEYEHLQDELVKDSDSLWHFNQVKNCANENKLELSDSEFKLFLKIQKADKDVEWIMHMMNVYKLSFTEALVSYITY